MSKKMLFSWLVGFFLLIPLAHAEVGGELFMFFQDSQGNPITTTLDVRISLWDVYTVRPGDVDAEGNITTAAPNFSGFQETLIVTPNDEKYFVPQSQGLYRIHPLKDLTDFPEIGPLNAFAQLEYKDHGSPNTDYKIYDFVDDVPFNNVQRFLMDTNAIYYTLDAGPQTNWNTFTIDDNNNAPTEIKLQFGDTLNESLLWSKTNVRFELSDSLSINGSLTLNGLLDFGLNEMVNARLENLATAPNCGENAKGRLFFNTSNNLAYYCNGTDWNQF